MNDNSSKTNISELGEFGLIKHLTQNLKLSNKETIKGVGDDAAVINFANKVMLMSSDMLIENVHFDLMYASLKHLGYKATIVNLSDIAAMNGIPSQFVLNIGISSKYTVEAIEELYEGVILACNRYKVDFVGGDTTTSPSGLVLSGTIVGAAQEHQVVYRNGAKEHDLVCVTGDLGAAYVGLLILEREKQEFLANPNMQPKLSGMEYLLERQLKPEARTDIIEFFAEKKIKPTSMIDISDGLASEIKHLCSQSNCGCDIYEEKLPIHPLTYKNSLEFKIDATTSALNGGEDYELLFTIQQKDYDKIKDEKRIQVIGHITEAAQGQRLITKHGLPVAIEAQGWDAFGAKVK